MTSNIETFVFDGVEVKKTGRIAERELSMPSSQKGRKLTLVEITPVDPVFDWKKWVNPAELYKVL